MGFQKFNKGKPFQKKFSHNTATLVKTEIAPEPEEKIVRANFTGQTDEEAFGPAFLYEEPEMFIEKREIPTNTNYMQYNQNQNNSIYEDDEEYPPNNICYECGKNLKWGNWCSDCGVSNEEDEEKETDVTLEQSAHNAIEERLEIFAEEIRKWKEKTRIERDAAIDDVAYLDKNQRNMKEKITNLENQMSQILERQGDIEFLNKEMSVIAVHVSEAADQIKQIKNSDVNNGTEFYRLKNEIGDLVHERIEEVYENMSLTNENVETTAVTLDALITEHNKNLPDITEMEDEVHELLKWKSEVNAKLIKTETITGNSVDKKTESNPDLNVEGETDIEINIEDEFKTKTISVREANIRLEWYKFSERFVTEEYKVKYVP